jgi:hypothetical protein
MWTNNKKKSECYIDGQKELILSANILSVYTLFLLHGRYLLAFSQSSFFPFSFGTFHLVHKYVLRM